MLNFIKKKIISSSNNGNQFNVVYNDNICLGFFSFGMFYIKNEKLYLIQKSNWRKYKLFQVITFPS
jgi:hypothetical protein